MPIRTRDEMRRAIQAGVPQAAAAPQLSERQLYMNRMRARTGGAVQAPASAARPEGYTSYGTYTQPGVGEFDVNTGRMITGPIGASGPKPSPTLGSNQPAIEQRVAYSRPAAAARTEAANALLQQHGGGPAAGNLTQPLVPKEDKVVAAIQNFSQAREADPLAAAPAVLDQRSAEYGQRADIQAWIEANKNAPKGADGMNVVDRFLAKQRKAEPQAMRPTDPGLETAYGGQIQVAPKGAELSGVPFKDGELPAGAPQALSPAQAGAAAAFGQDMNVGPAPQAPVYQGPAPDRAPAGMGQSAEALQQAFSGELDVVPQGTAQQSNLNFNSPLPAANLKQAFEDTRKKQLLNNPILGKYLNAASGINNSWNA